jgi:hypothetical protein
MISDAPSPWDAWRSDPKIRQVAEQWITKPAQQWSEDDEELYGLLHSEPDRALAILFGMMQLSDDPKIHGAIAAGPLETFLGVHGEKYLDLFHSLALQHRRLREVLDGVWQGAMPNPLWRKIEMLQQRAFS